jgi:hypothetical protein
MVYIGRTNPSMRTCGNAYAAVPCRFSFAKFLLGRRGQQAKYYFKTGRMKKTRFYKLPCNGKDVRVPLEPLHITCGN